MQNIKIPTCNFASLSLNLHRLWTSVYIHEGDVMQTQKRTDESINKNTTLHTLLIK